MQLNNVPNAYIDHTTWLKQQRIFLASDILADPSITSFVGDLVKKEAQNPLVTARKTISILVSLAQNKLNNLEFYLTLKPSKQSILKAKSDPDLAKYIMDDLKELTQKKQDCEKDILTIKKAFLALNEFVKSNKLMTLALLAIGTFFAVKNSDTTAA